MTGKPRIVLFTGEGKGKTTAALGMVLRAVGHDLTAAVVQFIKGDSSTGECAALERLGVEVHQGGRGFTPSGQSPRFAEHRLAAEATLGLVSRLIRSGRYDMIVLDEICGAITKGLLAPEDVLAVLRHVSGDCVLALTGRNAPEGLRDIADTVSEIACPKHGYAAGIVAQKGVEF